MKVTSLVESIEETNANVLEQERDSVDSCRDRMNDAHENYYKELYDPKKLDEALKWFAIRDQNTFNAILELTKPCSQWKNKSMTECL